MPDDQGNRQMASTACVWIPLADHGCPCSAKAHTAIAEPLLNDCRISARSLNSECATALPTTTGWDERRSSESLRPARSRDQCQVDQLSPQTSVILGYGQRRPAELGTEMPEVGVEAHAGADPFPFFLQ